MTNTNEQTALDRAADRLRRNGIVPLQQIAHLETARIAHNADGKYPQACGWVWIAGRSVHYSSYVEDAHPTKIFKMLIDVLQSSAIDIDVDHRDRSIRLRPEAESQS